MTKDSVVIYELSGNAIFPHTLSLKGTLSKMLLNIKCSVWFSVQHLSKTFIVRRIERDIVINEHAYSCKTSVIIDRFSLKFDILK